MRGVDEVPNTGEEWLTLIKDYITKRLEAGQREFVIDQLRYIGPERGQALCDHFRATGWSLYQNGICELSFIEKGER